MHVSRNTCNGCHYCTARNEQYIFFIHARDFCKFYKLQKCHSNNLLIIAVIHKVRFFFVLDIFQQLKCNEFDRPQRILNYLIHAEIMRQKLRGE